MRDFSFRDYRCQLLRRVHPTCTRRTRGHIRPGHQYPSDDLTPRITLGPPTQAQSGGVGWFEVGDHIRIWMWRVAQCFPGFAKCISPFGGLAHLILCTWHGCTSQLRKPMIRRAMQPRYQGSNRADPASLAASTGGRCAQRQAAPWPPVPLCPSLSLLSPLFHFSSSLSPSHLLFSPLAWIVGSTACRHLCGVGRIGD